MVTVRPQGDMVRLGVFFLSALFELKSSLLGLPLPFGPIGRPAGIQLIDDLLVDFLIRGGANRSNDSRHGLSRDLLRADSSGICQSPVGKAVLPARIHRRNGRRLIIRDHTKELRESGKPLGSDLEPLGFRRSPQFSTVLPGGGHRNRGQSKNQHESDQHRLLPLFGRSKRLFFVGRAQNNPRRSGNFPTQNQTGNIPVARTDLKPARLGKSEGRGGIRGVVR